MQSDTLCYIFKTLKILSWMYSLMIPSDANLFLNITPLASILGLARHLTFILAEVARPPVF